MQRTIACSTMAAVLLAAACLALTETRTIVVGGAEREYVIDIPAACESSCGLLLCFHGMGGTASGTRQYARFFEWGADDGFITVYPQGINILSPLTGDSTTGWVFAVADNRDVEFVSALLDSLESGLTIDPARIFVTGVSNGGFFSDILGCTIGDRLAAIAPVIGGYQWLVSCSITKPLPVFRLGTAEDEIVDIAMLRASTEFWVGHNGCGPTPAVEGMCQTYGGCDGGAEVVHCEYGCSKTRMQPACHTWPLPPSYEFSTTELVLDFFRAHGLAAPSARARPRWRQAGRIGRSRADAPIQVFDIRGRALGDRNGRRGVAVVRSGPGCAVRLEGIGRMR